MYFNYKHCYQIHKKALTILNNFDLKTRLLQQLEFVYYKKHVLFPCYNEASRIILQGFGISKKTDRYRFVFVNDGSSDDTKILVNSLAKFHQIHIAFGKN